MIVFASFVPEQGRTSAEWLDRLPRGWPLLVVGLVLGWLLRGMFARQRPGARRRAGARALATRDLGAGDPRRRPGGGLPFPLAAGARPPRARAGSGDGRRGRDDPRAFRGSFFFFFWGRGRRARHAARHSPQ